MGMPTMETPTIRSPAMMEWETTNESNSNNKERHQRRQKQKQPNDLSRQSSAATTFNGVTDAERQMIQTLLPSDVLLVGKDALCQLVPGNTFYNEEISRQRPVFLEYRDDFIVQNNLIHSIIQSIWSNNGRFLEYDSWNGVITILTNDKVKQLIRRDLKKNKQSQQRQQQRKKNHRIQIRNLKRTNKKSSKATMKSYKKNVNQKSVRKNTSTSKAFGKRNDGIMFGDV